MTTTVSMVSTIELIWLFICLRNNIKLQKQYIRQNMAYAKERGKFEKLSTKVIGLTVYDVKSLAVITDIYEQYSHTVRILKNKAIDIFGELYQNDLQQVKECKRLIKENEGEEDRQNNFIKYRDTLANALERAIQATKESI